MTKMDEAVDYALASCSNTLPGEDVFAFHRALRERGYVVVPVEPTRNMRAAGFLAWLDTGTEGDPAIGNAYRAMIAAAQEG